MSKKIKVDGIAVYASVQKPNSMTDAYSVDLVVDSSVEKELLRSGLKPAKNKLGELVAHKGFEGKVFRFKRKVTSRDGKKLSPPLVVDSQGTAVRTLIGNGSKVRVYGSAYSYTTPTGVSGVAAGLNTVQIIELVEYGNFDKIEGGYTSTKIEDKLEINEVAHEDDGDII